MSSLDPTASRCLETDLLDLSKPNRNVVCIVFSNTTSCYHTIFIAAIRVWYGDPEIAIVSTDAGKWDPNFELSNMFDSDATTSWHSANGTQERTKIITIDFLVRTSNSVGLYHMTLSVWATVWANLWIGP